MKERRIQRDIMLAIGSLPGVVVWRNNVGLAVFPNGDKVKYGLCDGSSDLIGLVDGRFLALEVKRPGQRPTQEQQDFLAVVRMHGGYAAIVTSVEDAQAAVKEARE